MKQQITLTQLNQLTRAKKSILSEFQGHPKDMTPHLPNIGEMIEFLDDNDEYIKTNTYIDSPFGYTISANYSEGVAIGWDDHKELVDALWEAVKEVLE